MDCLAGPGNPLRPDPRTTGVTVSIDGSRLAALVVMDRDAFDRQFDETRLARLGGLACLPDPIFVDDLDDPALERRLAEVEVLLTGWGAPCLDAARLDRMPRLRAMLHCAGSVRPQVSEEFWRRGIRATSAAEANAVPVAEYTFAALVLAGKKAPFIAADPAVRRDDSRSIGRYGELSNEGRTIGVVGFSRVGRRVVQLVRQLHEATCLVADPVAGPEDIRAAGGVPVPLEEMLPRVDVLTLHAPALPSTRGMIGAEQLAALPPHATVINTARGALVDTAALERECASGRLNAILDVTDPEPLPVDSVLYRLPNVMVTPHLAGSLGSETKRMTDAALDELERYVSGEPLRFEVTRDDMRFSA
ncbi:hydroxyacid dehydrogenase [Cnuibacter physcomitrellae]|uniref:Hydroxyacid dehydrogenase n=1 Tax=Cnuibacter physcomitrellae TaxID=1619308 RepID=A0A1X9LJS6_9MICO|nr:hydroxyacid dehydrogenase [Cnuibacter physcomitrellae]GGI41330.1 hydroxyacid dehydrogenase [Cnuibacter physcomitrellae]